MTFHFTQKLVWFLTVTIGILCAKEKPKGVGKILDIKECETKAENPFKMKNLYLDSASDGFKKMSADIEFTRDLDKALYYTITIEQYKNGNWDFVIDREGSACDLLKEYAADAWVVIRQSANPAITEECEAPAGTYKFRDLEITRDEFKPDAIYGTIRATVKLFENQDTSENFACAEITLEIFQRMPQMG